MPADLNVTRTRLPDISERLPASANARLATLRQMRDDAQALQDGTGERLSDARMELANAEGALRALKDADESGHLVTRAEGGALDRFGQRKVATQDRDLARIEVAESRVRRAREELDTIIARQAALSARRAAFAAVVQHCEAWTLQQTGPLAADARPAPKMKRGENVVAAVERTRAQLSDLHGQQERTRRAPLPTADARQRLRSRVLNAADAIPPANISAIISSGLEAHQWTTRPLSITTLTPTAEGEPALGRGTARVPDITAILAALFPEQLIAFLEQSLPDDSGCLSDEERFALLAGLEAEIEQVERDEASLLFQAMQAGADVLPRQDAAPAAVLAVTS